MESSDINTLKSLYTFNANVGTFSSGATTETGQFIEDTQVLKDLIVALFYTSFGMETPDPATPMGRLVEWWAMFFANSMRINVQNANQLVLSAAAGQQLDAIALWFGLYRKPAVPSTVTATLRGDLNAVIPAGSRARTEDGAIFVLAADATITDEVELPDGTTYQTTAVFRSAEDGPIGCPAHTLTAIDTPMSGWNTVTNEEDGVIGRDTETDDSLRARIEASRFHGNGFIYSMKNAIEAIDGVNSSMVVENDTGEEKTVHGVDAMAPHSIFVCVDCPPDAKAVVAQAVFDTKPCGTAYHKIYHPDTHDAIFDEVPVTDAYGNSYSVILYTPDPCDVNAEFVIKNRSYSGSDIVADVKAAAKAFADSHGYKIGEAVYASDIIRAVEAAVSGVIVVSCGVTTGGTRQAQERGVAVAHAVCSLPYLEVAAYQKASFNIDRMTVTLI